MGVLFVLSELEEESFVFTLFGRRFAGELVRTGSRNVGEGRKEDHEFFFLFHRGDSTELIRCEGKGTRGGILLWSMQYKCFYFVK